MDKKSGYLLILAGVGILLASAAILVVTLYGGMQAPKLFTSEAVITLTLAQGSVNVPLPPHLNQAANLSIFMLGMLMLAGIGAKIGRLGIQLVRQPPLPKEPPPGNSAK